MHGAAMVDALKELTTLCSELTEAVATLIIVYAVAEVLVRTVIFIGGAAAAGFRGPDELNLKEAIRLRLGTWLALALEVFIAADILRTVVAPTWNELGQLAAIIVLRIVLNYFLQRDIDAAERRQAASPPAN